MENKMEKLTIEQAIEKGYTHFVEEEGESIIKLSSVDANDLEYYKNKKCYIVDMKTPKHYTIDEDTIRELISDYVAGQEEMADEQDKLFTIAATHDYSTIVKELNTKFSAINYYEPLDILVVF